MGRRIIPSTQKQPDSAAAPKAEKSATSSSKMSPGFEKYKSAGFSDLESHALSHHDEHGKHPEGMHELPKQAPSEAFLRMARPIAQSAMSKLSGEKVGRMGSEAPRAVVKHGLQNQIRDSKKAYAEESAKALAGVKDWKERRKIQKELWDKHMSPHKEKFRGLHQEHAEADKVSEANQILRHAAISGQMGGASAASPLAEGGIKQDPHQKVLSEVGAVPELRQKSQEKMQRAQQKFGGKAIQEAQRIKQEFDEKAAPLKSQAQFSPEEKKVLGLYLSHYGDIVNKARAQGMGKKLEEIKGTETTPDYEAMASAIAQFDPKVEKGHFGNFFRNLLHNKFKQTLTEDISPHARSLKSKAQKMGAPKPQEFEEVGAESLLPSSLEDAHAEIKRLREQLSAGKAPEEKSPAEVVAPEGEKGPDQKEGKTETPEEFLRRGGKIKRYSAKKESPSAVEAEPATPEKEDEVEIPYEQEKKPEEEVEPESDQADGGEEVSSPESIAQDYGPSPEAEAESEEGAKEGSSFEDSIPKDLSPEDRQIFEEELADKLASHKFKHNSFPKEYQAMLESEEVPEDFIKKVRRAMLKKKGFALKG